MSEKSSFRSLLEMSDKIAREELGDYYVMGASRMHNMLDCLEDGAKQIQVLTEYKLSLSTELTAYMVATENQKDTIEKYRSALQIIADDETDYPKSVAKAALEI